MMTTTRLTVPQALSWLILYPGEGYHEALAVALETLNEQAPELIAPLLPGLEYLRATPLEEVQELYCATFDFSKDLTLELGWHLYGEDHHRGAWLSELNAQRATLNMPSTVELADHVGNLLLLLERITPEERQKLLKERIIPAMDILIKNFQEHNHPYRSIVTAIATAFAKEGSTDHE